MRGSRAFVGLILLACAAASPAPVLAQDSPYCRSNTPQGTAAYQQLRQFLLLRYPERLVRQIDVIPRCQSCMSSPRGFEIEAVYQGSDRVEREGWSAKEEARILKLVIDGTVSRFRIRYQGDDCACCDAPAHSTAAWIDKRSAYSVPSDLTAIPPVEPPDAVPSIKQPPALRLVHSSCGACIAKADARNDLAEELNHQQKLFADFVFQKLTADADSKRWEERNGHLREIPLVDSNRAALLAAMAEASRNHASADVRAAKFELLAKAAKQQIDRLTPLVTSADSAFSDCLAKICAAPPKPPVTPKKDCPKGGGLVGAVNNVGCQISP